MLLLIVRPKYLKLSTCSIASLPQPQHGVCHCLALCCHFTGERLRFPSQYPTSCLLGCVNVIDCLPQEEYRINFPEGESDSPFVFVCEDAQELPIRFPIQGKHKICKKYKLDPKIHAAAQKSLQRMAKLQAERALL
ncbi:hypothetical protein ANN_10156 [Periplaneta americana]|uniref:Uncharacterized protein n=1 Tax=Periplaneta americana TaxID=6978 RepID=A0ABQ8TQM7_PERAM|nr:hypothetical protein ANN_10156 [Periplaneta americana]